MQKHQRVCGYLDVESARTFLIVKTGKADRDINAFSAEKVNEVFSISGPIREDIQSMGHRMQRVVEYYLRDWRKRLEKDNDRFPRALNLLVITPDMCSVHKRKKVGEMLKRAGEILFPVLKPFNLLNIQLVQLGEEQVSSERSTIRILCRNSELSPNRWLYAGC